MSLRVGVLGATGAVGSTIVEVLAEREFPADEVVALASERSAGKRVEFGDGELEVVAVSDEAIDGLDLVLSSAGSSVSAAWAPKIVAAGGVIVDNTSFWRMHSDVPLVIPEVNPEAIDSHHGIVANPNCTTMALLVAIAPIHRAVGIERLVVSTYQAVSGTGQKAIDEMIEQLHSLLHGHEPEPPAVYPHEIAFNVIPQVETFKDGDDYTTEERKVMAETRKILGAGEELRVSATCARVPVVVGHSESVNIQTREDLSPEACRELIAAAPGAMVADDPADGIYPTAVDVAGQDDVVVGRIRRDPSQARTLNMWVVGDNLRKGAALNAVQVAELLLERDLIRVPDEPLRF